MSDEQKPPYGITAAINAAAREVFLDCPSVSCWIAYDGTEPGALPKSIKVRLGDLDGIEIPYSHEAYIVMSAIVARASRSIK